MTFFTLKGNLSYGDFLLISYHQYRVVMKVNIKKKTNNGRLSLFCLNDSSHKLHDLPTLGHELYNIKLYTAFNIR